MYLLILSSLDKIFHDRHESCEKSIRPMESSLEDGLIRRGQIRFVGIGDVSRNQLRYVIILLSIIFDLEEIDFRDGVYRII